MNIITKARIIIIIKALTIIKNTKNLVAEFLVKAKILLAEFLVKNITDDVAHHVITRITEVHQVNLIKNITNATHRHNTHIDEVLVIHHGIISSFISPPCSFTF
jgi:hypothetical protein